MSVSKREVYDKMKVHVTVYVETSKTDGDDPGQAGHRESESR